MRVKRLTTTNTGAIAAALGAAMLFGASTPFAKVLVGEVSPIWLAGLLYLGSGLGLLVARLLRDGGWKPTGLVKQEWPWLLGAVAVGGMVGPVLLMIGLVHTTAGTASLLLNLEAVLTALLAWIVFRENADRRIVFGMVLIVAGGLALSWPATERVPLAPSWLGPLAIAGACLCWAIDNNLTRKVSASDALFIAGAKGMIAGTINTALAFSLGSVLPAPQLVGPALVLGFLGYGLSLFLFVLALRGLGTARTGAYFATAPFIGAAVAIIFFQETTTTSFWIAAGLMATGVALHVTERHAHEHVHEAVFHAHAHVHDVHHQHVHDPDGWDQKEPHTHPHRHEPLRHAHPHFPDTHHRHRH